jgi:hypothetical protein
MIGIASSFDATGGTRPVQWGTLKSGPGVPRRAGLGFPPHRGQPSAPAAVIVAARRAGPGLSPMTSV